MQQCQDGYCRSDIVHPQVNLHLLAGLKGGQAYPNQEDQ